MMHYRRFGRTEIRMPVFTCGGMRYQFKWQDTPLEQIPEDNQRNLEDTIRRALDLGINHIETARGYGSSERQLGVILPTVPRDSIIVQTKVGPEEDGARFRENVLDSLARLRLEYVDLLAIHGINDEQGLQWSVRPGGCLEQARRLQDEGRTRFVGFSTHGPLDIILRAIRTEDFGGFDYVNLHWYYIFQRNWPAIEEARRRDMGVFIISPSDKGGMLYRPPEKLARLCAPLHPMAFNDLWCLSRSEVHTLSVGAARPSDFDCHVEALDLWDVRERLLPAIEARLQAAMKDALGEDFAARWEEGLPDWQDVPGQINIKSILWLHNLLKAYDLEEYARMRYNLLGNGGPWFPGRNMSNLPEEGLGDALARSPFRDRIPAMLQETHARLWREPKKRLSQGG
ncbi:MAG: aldo/keto reductase [Candidatus Sumerlaeia bacterium]